MGHRDDESRIHVRARSADGPANAPPSIHAAHSTGGKHTDPSSHHTKTDMTSQSCPAGPGHAASRPAEIDPLSPCPRPCNMAALRFGNLCTSRPTKYRGQTAGRGDADKTVAIIDISKKITWGPIYYLSPHAVWRPLPERGADIGLIGFRSRCRISPDDHTGGSGRRMGCKVCHDAGGEWTPKWVPRFLVICRTAALSSLILREDARDWHEIRCCRCPQNHSGGAPVCTDMCLESARD